MDADRPNLDRSGGDYGGAAEPKEGGLGDRIEQARRALEPEKGPDLGQKYNSLTMAWRMTLELVVGTAMGFAVGWGLDALFGTKPAFMIAFGLLGVATGLKLVLETAKTVNRPPAEGSDATPGAAARRDESESGDADPGGRA